MSSQLACPNCSHELYAKQVQETLHPIWDEDGTRTIDFDSDRDYECEVEVVCHGCKNPPDISELNIEDYND